MNTTASSTHPEIYRIVLGPSIETLWLDLNQSWDLNDEQALDIEARILALTQPSLCLDPSFEVTAIANHALRTTSLSCPEAGTGQGVANGNRKRPQSSVSEEEERRLAKRERLMRSMDESLDRPFVPTFARLGFVEQWREEQDRKKAGTSTSTTPAALPKAAPTQDANRRPQHPLAQSHLPLVPPAAAAAVKRKPRASSSRAGSEAGSPPPSSTQTKKKAIAATDKAARGAKIARGRGRGGARVKNMPPPQPAALNGNHIPVPQGLSLADLPQLPGSNSSYSTGSNQASYALPQTWPANSR